MNKLVVIGWDEMRWDEVKLESLRNVFKEEKDRSNTFVLYAVSKKREFSIKSFLECHCRLYRDENKI